MFIPGSETVDSRSYDGDGGFETSDLGSWQ
jgi:hypothetical protein